MFNFKRKNDNVPDKLILESEFSLSKPLVYIPNYGESSSDSWPRLLWGKIFKGESDVLISRAELDLRKAMQLLSFSTDSSISSFQALFALSLPGTTAALVWVIQALLQEKYPKPNLDNSVYYRNHDARLLFQQLSKINLDPWYSHSINWIPLNQLSTEFRFPAGHPTPGQIYRRHPLSNRQNFYCPINIYFSLLFEERKKALLNLLEDLGATQITISPVCQANSLELEHKQSEIIKYDSFSRALTSKPTPFQNPWLAYESSWKSIVDARFENRIPSIRCDLNLDVMEMFRTHIQAIISLISELSSMSLPSNYEDIFLAEFLSPQRFEVIFNDL